MVISQNYPLCATRTGHFNASNYLAFENIIPPRRQAQEHSLVKAGYLVPVGIFTNFETWQAVDPVQASGGGHLDRFGGVGRTSPHNPIQTDST
jgi:hypothetical protein